MKRKYRNITVSHQVNVSSTSHLAFYISVNGVEMFTDGYGEVWRNGKREGIVIDVMLPRYALDFIKSQIGVMARNGDLKFFEYDPDRNKRYDDLRYLEPGDVEELKTWGL